mgnify:CR=1 FL=1|tara:strand:- start:213 stop:404 length:192 start_codon:yes stop_codon:yes gene_type:complete
MNSDQFDGLIKIAENLESYQKKELVIVAMASDLSPTAAKKVGQKIIALAEAEEAQRMENKDVN